MFALSTPEWIDLGVAVGTGLLALATFVLARQARSQAKASVRLADLTERRLHAASTPVIRVMRDEEADYADIVTVNKGEGDESLVVRFENAGPTSAEIQQLTMVPGGRGKLVDVELRSPTLGPEDEWDVDFQPSDDDKAQHARGIEVLIQVVYLAPGSGARYRVRTYVKRDLEADRERWLVLREETPRRIGE